jgi:hypothetical protein
MEKNESDAGLITSLIMITIGVGIILYYSGVFDGFLIVLKVIGGITAYILGGVTIYYILLWILNRYR